MPGSLDLAFQGLTFVLQDGAAYLLSYPGHNIAAVNKVLFPLLSG